MSKDRQDIIDAVRACLHTPFAHQGRQPGLRLDCAGLVRVPFVVCAGRDDDFTNYGTEPVPSKMYEMLRHYFKEKPKSEIKPGDVLWLRILNDPQHLAVFTGSSIIHAVDKRKVVEHGYRAPWPKKAVAVFQYPWVED